GEEEPGRRRLKGPAGAHDLALEGGLAAAGKARDVALRGLLPSLQSFAALKSSDQRMRHHEGEEKDRDIDDQRHGAKSSGAKSSGAKSSGAKSSGAKSSGAKSSGAKSSGAISAACRMRTTCCVTQICRVTKSAIPGPADPPPTRLWTRGLPAFRTWGTVAM